MSQRENDVVKTGKHVTTKKSKVKKRKKQSHKGVKIFLLVVAIILIIISGVFAYKVYENGWGLQGLLSTVLGQNKEKIANMDEIQFLVIGESGNMTDTIIACTYNPKTQDATMVSIPRDTFIGSSESKATTSDKINCRYNINKDPMDTVKAVNKVTGLNLQYYVFVDTEALIKVVDAIGGVEFDVPIDMDYDDSSKQNTIHIHLKQGVQTIDGEKAEQLLRFRHNNDGTSYPVEYGDNDLGRMRTQREFIKATISQTIQANNIFKIDELLNIAATYVKTNIPLSLTKDYIPCVVGFNTENLKSEMLPNTTKMLNNLSFVIVNESETEKLINDVFYGGTKEVSDEENKPVTVELLNGSDKPENLKIALEALEKYNYDVVKVGNTTVSKKTTITNRTKQSNSIITEINSILNISSKSTTGKDNVDADLTIIIGKDYNN